MWVLRRVRKRWPLWPWILGHLTGDGSWPAFGLHIRGRGETRWHFNDRGEKVEVVEGDRVLLVMESPPSSVERPPLQDFEAEQAICILGCELKAP